MKKTNLLLASILIAISSTASANDTESTVHQPGFDSFNNDISDTNSLLGDITENLSSIASGITNTFNNLVTSTGVAVDTSCDNIKPVAQLHTCDELGLSQPIDIAAHSAFYNNPNAGCDLSLALPGLPSWDMSGGLNFSLGGFDLCSIANEFLQEVSGNITDSVNSALTNSFSLDQNGNFAGATAGIGGGISLTGTTQNVSIGGASSNFGETSQNVPVSSLTSGSSSVAPSTGSAVNEQPSRPRTTFSSLYE